MRCRDMNHCHLTRLWSLQVGVDLMLPSVYARWDNRPLWWVEWAWMTLRFLFGVTGSGWDWKQNTCSRSKDIPPGPVWGWLTRMHNRVLSIPPGQIKH